MCSSDLICHPSLRTCFIWWLFVRFKSLGPIPRQSTGIWKPGYYTELWTHYTINSVILMIFSLSIIHNRDRMSSITRVLHTTTWDYFTHHLPDRFFRSPRVVKEAIMTDINDLVQEFRTSSDGPLGHLSLQCVVWLEFCAGVLVFWKCVLKLFWFFDCRRPSS